MMMSTRILSLLVFTSTHYFKVLSFGLQKSSSFAGIHRSLVTRTIPSMNSDSHQSSSVVPVLSPDEQVILDKFRSHQEKAPRLSFAEEVRTLIDQSIGFGVLSTNSVQYGGFPTGSVVGFNVDEDGLPFFVFSSMSAHTKDILVDGRVSLTITSKDFKGAAEGRVVLIGNISPVTDASEKQSLRDKYLLKHKDAYWIDFGDFSYFKMSSLIAIRFVGGFAMAGSVSVEDYKNAKPDPVAAFATPVMTHMNDDHADSVIAMIKHYAGVSCSEASIVSLDKFGMTVKAKLEIAGGGYGKVRLPFPRPVTERKQIKEVIVEMTKASSS